MPVMKRIVEFVYKACLCYSDLQVNETKELFPCQL